MTPQRSKPFTPLEHRLLSHFSHTHEVGIGLASILYAAERRDVQWRRLDGRKRFRFDNGRQLRRLNGLATDRTSVEAITLAGEKIKARDAMHAAGLPVPRQLQVHSVEQAVRAARKLGVPLVTKPVRGNDGKGVTIGLRNPDEIRAGYQKALNYCDRVLIEEQIDGSDFRLLVIGGALIAAVKRIPARVQGDGVHTIRELIDIVNTDPRRGHGHTNLLTTIVIDDEMQALLKSTGYTLDAVPPEETYVYLRKIANVSLGGIAVDVTDAVHPDVEQMAIDSTIAVGLDIAGVDYITHDISRSWRKSGGQMCEINAGPGLRIHLAPSEGAGRDVGESIIDWLFREHEHRQGKKPTHQEWCNSRYTEVQT